MRKMGLVILVIPLLLAGCTQILDAMADEESNPIFYPPPEQGPKRIGECLLEYDCPFCGECCPIEIAIEHLPLVKKLPPVPHRVISTYLCQNTGKEFQIGRYECDEIAWKNYWIGEYIVITEP